MTTEVKPNYKRVSRIKDTKFTIDELDHYSLVMQVGISDIQFAVIDSQDNVCMALEDYILQGVKTVNSRLMLIKQILDNHEFLTAGFWKDVKLSLKTHKFTLVPSSMFVSDNVADYLALNSEIKTSFEEVNYYKQISTDTINVFASETKLCRWVESIYKKKKVHIIHQGSSLIEGVLKHAEHISEKSMYCFVDRSLCHVLVTEKKKILFYNQFSSKNRDEIAKYILIVFQENKMNPKKHQLFMWGFTKQNSKEITILKKYIHHISFGSRPSFLKFRYQYDEIPDHLYFDVLGGYLCI